MPYKDKDRRNEANRIWQKKQRDDRVKNGLCPRCGKPTNNEKRNCDDCADKINCEVAKRYRKTRENVILSYGGKCICCGEDHIEFLAIDHVNGNGRQDRDEKGKSGFYRWLAKNNYPEGYQILCHNCNWAKFAYGICPHQKGNQMIMSILDTDFYKLTQQQVVFHKFPEAIATYQFINRGIDNFPVGFADRLRVEVDSMSHLSLSNEENQWLRDQSVFKSDYVNWLNEFKFKPADVIITQHESKLNVSVRGKWKNTILWEVPLMAIISELYFRMTNAEPANDWQRRIVDKAANMNCKGVNWIDFGTRRRFSKAAQDAVVAYMRLYDGFKGTSNPYFAMKYKVPVSGTYAHESVMAMQALHGATLSNRAWMGYWMEEYKPSARIALTDTLTTDIFLRDFDKEMADAFSGVRQDSGDPAEFGRKMLQHYRDLGIDPKTKKIVFSDSLNDDKAIALQKEFGEEIPCVMGIGTFLTNDCGHKPLNMVIKLTGADFGFGDGLRPVVKLSDDEGKHTGDPVKVKQIKEELGLCPAKV